MEGYRGTAGRRDEFRQKTKGNVKNLREGRSEKE